MLILETAFQAEYAGSIPATRSSSLLLIAATTNYFQRIFERSGFPCWNMPARLYAPHLGDRKRQKSYTGGMTYLKGDAHYQALKLAAYYRNRAGYLAQKKTYYQRVKAERAAGLRPAPKKYNRTKLERMAWMRAIKTKSPCKDCGGYFPPFAMEFDHLPGTTKVMAVSSMIHKTNSIDRIKQEIAKCDLVCANCHRVRTHIRQHKEGGECQTCI